MNSYRRIFSRLEKLAVRYSCPKAWEFLLPKRLNRGKFTIPKKRALFILFRLRKKIQTFYNCLISSIRHKLKCLLGLQILQCELVLGIKADSNFREELKCNRLPQVAEMNSKKRENFCPTVLTFLITRQALYGKKKIPKKTRLLYTAKVEENKLNQYRRYIPDSR